MEYQKPPLNYEEQLDLLEQRGLMISDKNVSLHFLKNISYYRLSAYSLPFKLGEQFAANTSFEDIIELYTFDRKLRFLILEAIEPIEIALRAQTINHLSNKYGAFGYIDPKKFSSRFKHQLWLNKLNEAIAESSEVFIGHYKNKYHSQKNLPIWMALEIVSFGGLSRLFRGLHGEDLQQISAQYQLKDVVFISWLHVIVYTRNICAHHARLWNRTLTFKPKLPFKDKLWNGVKNDRIYCLLAMMQYFLQYINPNSNWKTRLVTLLEEHPQVSVAVMGFPKDWQENKLWK